MNPTNYPIWSREQQNIHTLPITFQLKHYVINNLKFTKYDNTISGTILNLCTDCNELWIPLYSHKCASIVFIFIRKKNLCKLFQFDYLLYQFYGNAWKAYVMSQMKPSDSSSVKIKLKIHSCKVQAVDPLLQSSWWNCRDSVNDKIMLSLLH